MSAAEYYDLVFELTNLYNSIFEFWITATFAFLVALQVLGSTLASNLRILLTTTYAAASAILTYRFILALLGVARILDEIERNGLPRPPWMGSNIEGYLWSISITLLMVLVSTASIVYAYGSRTPADKIARDANT